MLINSKKQIPIKTRIRLTFSWYLGLFKLKLPFREGERAEDTGTLWFIV